MIQEEVKEDEIFWKQDKSLEWFNEWDDEETKYFEPPFESDIYRAVDLFGWSEEQIKNTSWYFLRLMITFKAIENQVASERHQEQQDKSKLEQQRLKNKN